MRIPQIGCGCSIFLDFINGGDELSISGGILPCFSLLVLLMRRVLLLFAVVFALLPLAYAQETTPLGKLPIAQLQKLADTGDPAAQNEMGIRYRLGIGVEKDPAKAIPWFLKAAKQGFAKAYFNLGASYYNGDGVPVNDWNSCVWFMLAADAGDARGQEAVDRVRHEESPGRFKQCEEYAASAYLRGDLVPKDYGKAMARLTKAADAGSGFACANIAHMHAQGLGVPQDNEQALGWLKRAADLKFGPAMFELGRASELGQGVPQSFAAARKMYEKAAELGSSEAIVALGAMYAEGRGVKGDDRKALMYFIAAAYLGDVEGKRRADELATKMSPKQVASSQQAARTWVSQVRPLSLTPP
jgi:TPR repeat protein